LVKLIVQTLGGTLIILVTKISYKISPDEYRTLSYKVAQEINDKEMYNWKIWGIDEENSVGLTIYCLDDHEQADKVADYLNTMALIYHSILDGVIIERYEILEDATRLNYGPINFSDVRVEQPTID
jgi:hypothetical protein